MYIHNTNANSKLLQALFVPTPTCPGITTICRTRTTYYIYRYINSEEISITKIITACNFELVRTHVHIYVPIWKYSTGLFGRGTQSVVVPSRCSAFSNYKYEVGGGRDRVRPSIYRAKGRNSLRCINCQFDWSSIDV